VKHVHVPALGLALLMSSAGAGSAQPAARTDVYHVQFIKAVPGQAAALGQSLQTPDPKAPMPGHLIVLRHQQGDDWDYCVIEHLGAKAAVDAASPPPPAATRDMTAWHTDTFVAGPSWPEFSRAVGLTAGSPAGSVYSVAVHRAVPGHREQLEKALARDPAAKVSASQILMQHLEGGPWQYLVIARFNSWQDFAADQAGGDQAGWAEVRQHSVFHHDTIADRIPIK